MTLYLATNNKNKVREFSELLPNTTIRSASDLVSNFNPAETGASFLDNALIKAQALFDLLPQQKNCAVLADDSGITVNALGDVPGIYSARYAGEDFPHGTPALPHLNQRDQNAALIAHLNHALSNGVDPAVLQNLPLGERSAFYTCCVVLLYGRNRFVISQDTWEGVLLSDINESRGTNGFGYDPIFYLPELSLTAAELSAEQKNALSHRGKALKQLIPILRSL